MKVMDLIALLRAFAPNTPVVAGADDPVVSTPGSLSISTLVSMVQNTLDDEAELENIPDHIERVLFGEDAEWMAATRHRDEH